jgi:hypothetical protein
MITDRDRIIGKADKEIEALKEENARRKADVNSLLKEVDAIKKERDFVEGVLRKLDKSYAIEKAEYNKVRLEKRKLLDMLRYWRGRGLGRATQMLDEFSEYVAKRRVKK